jgi:hypothetical protein
MPPATAQFASIAKAVLTEFPAGACHMTSHQGDGQVPFGVSENEFAGQ